MEESAGRTRRLWKRESRLQPLAVPAKASPSTCSTRWVVGSASRTSHLTHNTFYFVSLSLSRSARRCLHHASLVRRSRGTARSSSASSSATSSLSAKASKTGLSGASRQDLLLTSVVFINILTSPLWAVCPQCAKDGDALPGQLCEGASAE